MALPSDFIAVLQHNIGFHVIIALLVVSIVSCSIAKCSLKPRQTDYQWEYPVAQAICNLYFHPLCKFPNPKLWAASQLPFVYCLLTGKLVRREREFYEKYGEIIRLAPDEVSFASEAAWNDIYTFRRGHKRALRDKTFYIGERSYQ